jgi:hypothetical protein
MPRLRGTMPRLRGTMPRLRGTVGAYGRGKGDLRVGLGLQGYEGEASGAGSNLSNLDLLI